MNNEYIKVGMADFKIGAGDDVLVTLGLGSCVGIVLYDKFKRIGGMAHIMLPSSKEIRNNANRAKFADTALDEMLFEIVKKRSHQGQDYCKNCRWSTDVQDSCQGNDSKYRAEECRRRERKAKRA